MKAAGNQKLGGKTLRAVSFTERGTNFVVLIDPQTKLPAAIRTRDDDNIDGDSTYDLVPSDWKAVGGIKMAHTLTYQLNGVEVAKTVYKEVTADPTIAADAFAVPEAVKSAAKAPATSNVPYQWVIRRLALGRSSTATASSFRPAAASSWSSSHPTCSTCRAARPTT